MQLLIIACFIQHMMSKDIDRVKRAQFIYKRSKQGQV